jgi:formylmethanofuran dehydrogenase subunit E
MHPYTLEPYFRQLALHHRNLCPRQVLGVRMGLRAVELLDLDLRQAFAIIETDGCFADAVSVATGCWLGKRNLRLFDYGKVAVTLIDLRTARGARVHPHPLARLRATALSPTATTHWHAQLEGYQRMPIEDLVCVEWVQLGVPVASLVSERAERTECAECREEVINARQLVVGARSLCRACAEGAYFGSSQPRTTAWEARAA